MIKYLKKIFLTVFVIGIIFFGFTNAGCIVQSSSDGHNMVLCDNNNLSYYYTGNNYFVGGISDSKLNFDDGVFKYYVPQVGNVLSYWWGLGSLNYTIKNYYGNGSSNGTINGFYYHNGAVGNDPLTFLSSRGYDFYTFDKLKDYLDDTYKYVDYYCAISNYDSNPYCIVCLTQGYDLGHICIDRSNSTYNSNNFIPVDQIISTDNPFYYVDTGIYFSDTGNLQIINSDLDNTIRYYEQRFDWDVDMCYVGTNDLTGVYGDSVEFELGSGKTIFELYYKLYNTFGSNTFSNVGSFINVNLLNYASWFENLDNPEERLYMAVYNGPDTNISMIYTGFTFPFSNKPVAQFFMTDLLYNDYIRESSQGIEIAYYCDLKLKYNEYKDGTLSFEETKSKIDPAILDRVGLYVDRNLFPNNGYLIPSSGSLWGSNTGYGIPSDISPSNLFSDFYSKVESLFGSFSPFYSVGIIPWWILYPMIFLILFRILRH